jgi:signal transduction histidine kinase
MIADEGARVPGRGAGGGGPAGGGPAGGDPARLEAAEAAVRRSGKMAALGELTAGVAHELNNPAAAAARSAAQLREAFARLQDTALLLSQLHFTPERARALVALATQDRERSAQAAFIDPLTRSDLESAVEAWLEAEEMPDAWELAPALVSLGYTAPDLAALRESWGDAGGTVITWLARAQPVLAMAREVEESARRMAEIAGALKTYAHPGQPQVAEHDVVRGLESTLTMMRGKLGDVTVVREYQAELPRIRAFGGELEQVWTNLIDNAVDATDGRGRVVVRARREGDGIVVEIEDDGPGMTDEVRRHVFTPFFTTKEPGKGTGLGLATSLDLVVRRGGALDVDSRPGRTTFIVRLPSSPPRESGPAAPAGA